MARGEFLQSVHGKAGVGLVAGIGHVQERLRNRLEMVPSKNEKNFAATRCSANSTVPRVRTT
jgi:TPP-dependent trihydroxycyclohexane-1,2-dione (THcHDO) dehydratase